MRARVSGFLKLDRPVLGDQLASLDRASTGSLAVGAWLRLMCVLGLLRGGLFEEPAGHASADLVGTPFDGGEVEVFDLVVGTKDLARDLAKDFIETSIRNGVIRGLAKHGESSLTTPNCPDRIVL